jgi:hypothetical protein
VALELLERGFKLGETVGQRSALRALRGQLRLELLDAVPPLTAMVVTAHRRL